MGDPAVRATPFPENRWPVVGPVIANTEPIISVSGLRGIVGQSLTPEVAVRYACAFAADLPPGPIVVSRDGRPSGRIIADALRSALAAVGRRVLDANIAATPTLGVLVRRHKAAGGIQISASHNPPEYNGLKLFSAKGRVLSASDGEDVLERYRNGDIAWAAHKQIGDVEPLTDTMSDHCALVLGCVDAQRIRRRQFRVVLDSNHGAGSLLGRRLLEELGCDVTLLGGEPDGHFSHRAEPTAEGCIAVCRRVKAMDVDVGFCQDPDADRLAVIDEAGRYIGEECTLALCLDHVLSKRKGAIVTNCATSRMAEDLAGKYNVPFFRTPVGEANVVDTMLAQNAVFGGEGNGGPIDPRVTYVRDSFIGMALILDYLAERQLTVSQVAAELPQYAIQKTTIPLDRDQVPAALDKLEQHFADAQPDRMDGLRLDWPNKWLLIRASNTEPIVRAIAEAESIGEAKRLCEEAADAIRQR